MVTFLDSLEYIMYVNLKRLEPALGMLQFMLKFPSIRVRYRP